ncbi:MAG: hypothetical protein AUJ72_06240 [Candidatus Omnitrophica bacterium CG1_02_46_14]|nr:MAG: hypothetical protein AUJ72_06240 [Candidatus Omnitrophica bacterium CG1_02_46_14]
MAVNSNDSSKIDLRNFKEPGSSQAGEAGLISAIFRAIGTTNKTCVDCGAFDLKNLSNVYPLWKEVGWNALLIEGNTLYFNRMKRSEVPGNVKLLNLYVFPRGDNSLDQILKRQNFPKEFDLISIDVDGIDYHLWKNFSEHQPRTVIIEYNPTIPPHLSVIGNENGNYIGASAKALTDLGVSKGYILVACTTTNLIFVLDKYASCFQNAGDLDKLFDYSAINYAMTSYDGALFYSNKFIPFGHNPFSNESKTGLQNPENFHIPNSNLSHYFILKSRSQWHKFRRYIMKPIILYFLRFFQRSIQ